MKIVALDTETHLIKPGCPAPRLVCVSTATEDGTGLYLREQGLEVAQALLRDRDTLVVGQHIFYDLGVLAAEDSRFLPWIFEALDAGRIADTKIRQMIIDNAAGELKFEINDLGEAVRASFTLQNLVLRHLNKRIEKGADTWRLRYRELDNVPIHEWPLEAINYAVGDAEDTLGVYLSQKRMTDPEGIPGEVGQTQAAWALYLLRLWGVRTDAKEVDALEAELKAAYQDHEKTAKAAGFIRENGKRHMEPLRDAVSAWYLGHGKDVPVTDTGLASTSRETLTDTDDPGLIAVSECVRIGKMLTTYVPVLRRGAEVPINAEYNPILETFRTSCARPNLQNLPRGGGARRCFVPRPGFVFVFCDYDTLEMRTLAQVCIDLFGYSTIADAIKADQDLHVAMAANILGISYDEAMARYTTGDAELVTARQYCFHPDTDALTSTGWKRVADLTTNDWVAAAIPENGSIRLEWQRPTALHRMPADELVHLRCEGMDLRVTKNHRMLAIRTCDHGPEVTLPLDLPKKRGWWNAGIAPGGSWDPDEWLLRMAVATQADGSVKQHQIRFGFTKERKISRMRWLLRDVPHREQVIAQDVTEFTVFGDNPYAPGKHTETGPADQIFSLLTDKQFDDRWLQLSSRGREIVLDEAKHWDATCCGHSVSYTYLSMIQRNAEVLQIIATLSGRKTRLVQDDLSRLWKLTVRNHPTRKNDRSRGDNLEATVIPHHGDVVCLTVPSSFVVVRDGGIPVVTGQSKIANYGLSGGMGPAAFVSYAKGYGIEIPLSLATKLRDGFRRQWPEMNDYFAHCSAMCSEDEAKYLTFVRSGLVRGRVRYTAVCNGYFQHLAAMGAKQALYEVSRESYLGVDRNEKASPLTGCRSWLFAHDEIGAEVPDDRQYASDAAARVEAIMVREMRLWTPDVPIGATATMTRRWYKGAKPLRENGLLVPSRPEGKTWVVDC